MDLTSQFKPWQVVWIERNTRAIFNRRPTELIFNYQLGVVQSVTESQVIICVGRQRALFMSKTRRHFIHDTSTAR